MKTILCFGDSNTHGSPPSEVGKTNPRYGKEHRWPDVMAGILGDDFDVIAEGLPGRTTVHEDPLFGPGRSGADILRPLLFSHAPINMLVIMLGTNDLKGQFRVRAVEIARSIERLIDITRATGVCQDIAIIAPVPVKECGFFQEIYAGAEERQAGLADKLAELAYAQETGFVDAGRFVTVSVVDGVHWEPEGQIAFGRAMAEHVLTHCEKVSE